MQGVGPPKSGLDTLNNQTRSHSKKMDFGKHEVKLMAGGSREIEGESF